MRMAGAPTGPTTPPSRRLPASARPARAGASGVTVGRGDADAFQAKSDYPAGAAPVALAVADVSGDGKPDVVTANRDAGTVSVLRGNGDGTLQPKVDYPIGAAPVAVV